MVLAPLSQRNAEWPQTADYRKKTHIETTDICGLDEQSCETMMNGSYSMKVTPEGTESRSKESFKFVSEKSVVKRSGPEPSDQPQPSCCLSVSHVSYSVR